MKRILVIGPSWVGDLVMAHSLFQCLRQRHAGLQLTVLAPRWCLELLERMPDVDQALELPLQHGELALGKRWRLARALGRQGFEQVIVLPNSFKTGLLARFTGIAERSGWRGEARGWLLNDCRRLDKSRYPLMVQRFAALGFPSGAPLPEPLPRPRLQARAEAVPALLQQLGLSLERPVLALCAGAEFGPAKQWPPTHFAEVAERAAAAGLQVWLLGSAGDSAAAAAICRLAPRAVNLCGQTTLGQAVDLLAVTAAVVSNDSGLMHVAAALARPLVVVYGSTSPAFTPPLAARVAVLSESLACSPCFQRECPLGHLDCLRRLSPTRVWEALQDLLAAEQA